MVSHYRLKYCGTPKTPQYNSDALGLAVLSGQRRPEFHQKVDDACAQDWGTAYLDLDKCWHHLNAAAINAAAELSHGNAEDAKLTRILKSMRTSALPNCGSNNCPPDKQD